jgi:hypothetical protein
MKHGRCPSSPDPPKCTGKARAVKVRIAPEVFPVAAVVDVFEHFWTFLETVLGTFGSSGNQSIR